MYLQRIDYLSITAGRKHGVRMSQHLRKFPIDPNMRGQPRCANVLDQTYPDRDLVLHRRQTHFPANDAKELVTPQEHYICMQKKTCQLVCMRI